MNSKWGLLGLCVLLAGCGQVQQKGDLGQKIELQSEQVSSQPVAQTATEGLKTQLIEISASGSYHLVSGQTHESLGSWEPSSKAYVIEMMALNQGFGVLVAEGEQDLNRYEVEGIISVDFPEEVKAYRWLLLDECLNEVAAINLSEVLPDSLKETMYYPLVAMSPDGQSILWSNYDNCLYAYNRNSGEAKQLLDENSPLWFQKIAFSLEGEKLIYFGSTVTTEEGDCTYGTIDLNTLAITQNIAKQYEGESIEVGSHYACLNDTVDPHTKASSGKVPVVNLNTGEGFEIQVSGMESTKAIVTDQLLLTAAEAGENYLVEDYDLVSGAKVGESLVTPAQQKTKLLKLVAQDNHYFLRLALEDGTLYDEAFEG